jgi:hypothetical protein
LALLVAKKTDAFVFSTCERHVVLIAPESHVIVSEQRQAQPFAGATDIVNG